MANLAADLPQELIIDILLRLPAKSIGQCRCVSRPWRSLLCNREFIKAHLTRHLHDPQKLIFVSIPDESIFISTFTSNSSTDAVSGELSRARNKEGWYEILGSCHGLVLVSSNDFSIFLMNPTTLEIVKLTNLSSVVDPFHLCSKHGLGYDSSSDDYKIVTLFHKDVYPVMDIGRTSVDVYSVKERTFRRVGISPYDHSISEFASGVFSNGSIHWLVRDTSIAGCPSVIAAFNLVNEKFEEVPSPSCLDGANFKLYELVVLGGCLGMVGPRRDDHVDFWVMKEYSVRESWNKFSVNALEPGLQLRPICQLGDEQVVLEEDCKKLVLHNFKEKTSRYMVVAGIPDMFDDGVMTYMDSVVSPSFHG